LYSSPSGAVFTPVPRRPRRARAFAFWLPTIPGAIAFFQLRRTVARWREERDGERARGAAAVVRA